MTLDTDKRVLRSKSDLKHTFLHLLEHKSFHQISISEIVREAHYNRGTFYANFATKEELLNEIVDDVLEEFLKQIKNPYRDITEVNLKEMHREDITLFKYIQENANLYKLLLSDHVSIDFRYKLARAIEDLFVAEYDYKLEHHPKIDPKWLYIFRAHGVAGILLRWIEEDFTTSPQHLNEQIVELMLLSTEVFHVKKH